MIFQYQRWETPNAWYCFLRCFSSMRLPFPEPKSFPQIVLQPSLGSQTTSPFSFSFCRHSSCSVLLLNEAMFYQLRFPDVQILVAALSQRSHHQPLPVSPLPNNTQAFQLGQSSCSWGQCWSGTDLVEAKSKANQNTYTKKKKTKSFLLYGVFCSQS